MLSQIKNVLESFEEKPIILLDLNYTLVGNSWENKLVRPYQRKIRSEEYRDWLVDIVRDYYVIMITARPKYQRELTLRNMERKIEGWMPEEAYFQEENDQPPVAKEKLLHKYIFPMHGRDATYFGIESNPRTRDMYRGYGIASMSVKDDREVDVWKIKNELKSKQERLI